MSKFTLIDGHNVTNAAIGFRAGNGWTIGVFARDLFNSNHIQNLTIQAGNSGLILGKPNEPRIIGATFGLRI